MPHLRFEVRDLKKYCYAVLIVENLAPFEPMVLMNEFTRFHADKFEPDKAFFMLPLAREWFNNRGFTARLSPSERQPLHIRCWSGIVLATIEACWRIYGLKIFRILI